MMLVNGVVINPFTSRQPEGNPTAQFNTNKVPVFIATMLFEPLHTRNMEAFSITAIDFVVLCVKFTTKPAFFLDW
jgi:hypothetical protein